MTLVYPVFTTKITCSMDRIIAADASALSWYCARTQPKHEHIAARNLRSRLGLEVFNPRVKMERATRRGAVRTVEPVFPCYVFVRCDLPSQADQIRHTFGVSSLVHFGPDIPAISDEVVEELRECFDQEEPLLARDPLRVGSEVIVAEGSLLGSRGIVVRLLPAKQRVQILLDFLGRTTLTEMDRGSLALEVQSVADMMPSLACGVA